MMREDFTGLTMIYPTIHLHFNVSVYTRASSWMNVYTNQLQVTSGIFGHGKQRESVTERYVTLRYGTILHHAIENTTFQRKKRAALPKLSRKCS